jgi:hypothetical protein
MMTKKFVLATGLLLITSLSFGQQSSQFFEASDAVFSTFVSNGKVDYAALKTAPDKLDKAFSLAKDLKIDPSKQATYKAFWINAYNLAVFKGIISNMPLSSPLDVAGFFDSQTFALGGTTLTLNDIENKKLRPIVKDARIHFVLVCGALGCPPIISSAYKPSIIDSQLEEQTIKALNNPEFIKLYKDQVMISEIFKWYSDDFITSTVTVIDFINLYKTSEIPAGTKVTYQSYNWQLNSL